MSFRPKCFYNEIEEAFTSSGHLIPCCNLDNRIERQFHEEMNALFDEDLKLENVRSKREIILSKQWKNFFKMLSKEENIPKPCINECGGEKLCFTYYEEEVKYDNEEVQVIKILK